MIGAASSPPSEWQYVAAAYLVVFVTVLVWVAVIGAKSRASSASSASSSSRHAPVVEVLFWPALLAYGEAAIAYASVRTRARATWGVRLGWLAQTALLVVQATRADGFPWSSWAGSLNLFVWLVVGAYLIWGCRPRFRLLGLGVMPLAVVLFAAARIGGGTGAGARAATAASSSSLHVGLVLAAFAGFTLAAALAGLYLWEERRLKRRAADILRLRLPPLQSLERLAWRTIVVSLPLLTLGLVIGISGSATALPRRARWC